MMRTQCFSSVLSTLRQVINHRNCCFPRNKYISRYCSLSKDGGVVRIGRHVICTPQAESDSLEQLTVKNDFISQEEEKVVMEEVDKAFRRSKYQYSHWDGAITGYRETEKSQWLSPQSLSVVHRVQEATVSAVSALTGASRNVLPHIHVLDLAEDGFISPHVDSVKFCGDVIAGLSLLSTSVMKLQHESNTSRWTTILLNPRSLYIIRGVLRYEYTHEIFGGQDSQFDGQPIHRRRRVSLVCRTEPSK